MFRSLSDLEREAYERQEQRIAYTLPPEEVASPGLGKPVTV